MMVNLCDGCMEPISGKEPYIQCSFELAPGGKDAQRAHEIQVHGWACLLKYWDQALPEMVKYSGELPA